MNYPKVLYQYKDRVGENFMPSNGTEGMMFCEAFCDNCINQHPNPDHKKQCNEILLLSMIGEQPKEWVFGEEGYPICTAWKKWDWGNDGDPDDRDNPKAPAPYDPNQLVMFSVADDVLQSHDPNQIYLLEMIEEVEKEQIK